MTKTNINNLAAAFVLARREMQDAEARAKALQEQLLELMTNSKMVVNLGDGDSATLTLVAPKRVTWVAASVKKILPVKFWNRVKVEAVDKTILEAMIASGELANYDLSPAKEISDTRPYLRLTEKPRKINVVSLTRKESA